MTLTNVPRSRESHIVVIVMENKESSDVLPSADAPYENRLARRYGLATESFGVAHPSLPNYLALTSGSTHGISSDCSDCTVAGPNLVDQLEATGISWRAYLEGVPSPCYRGAGAGGYAKRHNPFIYYDDIARRPSRCGELSGFGRLATDLRGGRLPTFAWITPNLCDDTHDCAVAAGDRFLARTVPSLLTALGPRGFLILTWDEGDSDSGCCAGAASGGHIPTIVAGPGVRRGGRDAQPVDHYGVLRTIEDALGLAPLGAAADRRNGTLDPLFARPPRLRAG